MNHFRRTLEALQLVSPMCMSLRFDDGFAHCVEASVAAAGALRGHNIKTRVVPCAVVVQGPNGEQLSIGLGPRYVYDHIADDGTKPPYDEWLVTEAARLPREEHPLHVVVEAKLGGEKAIVDLTLGQLRGLLNAPIPLQFVKVDRDGDWWPDVEAKTGASAGWSISYMASPHPQPVLAKLMADVNRYEGKGYIADLKDAMKLAIQCGLDRDRLYAVYQQHAPKEWAVFHARMTALAEGR